jgi:cyclase
MTTGRRAAVLMALLCGALALTTSGFQGGSPNRPARAVALQKVRDNLYLLTGGGGNSAFLVTDLGVVLVDTKSTGWGQAILDKVKTVTSKPVTTIINTHAHGDQIGGNEFFPTSVEIIAQDNTRLSMDKLEGFKGAKVNYLPKLMFKDKMTIGSGKDRIDLYYFGAAHTGGDAWVVFPALRVLHAGDLIAAKQPPIIDLENGGSGLAYSDTLAKGLARLTDVDVIIPGQGPLTTPKELEEYARFNKDFRDAVLSGYHSGLSVSEVAERWNVPQKYRDYTAPAEQVKANVRTIFGELTRATP